MANLTTINTDPDVYTSSFPYSNGKFGLWIGTIAEDKHEFPLLISAPAYDTAKQAKAAADKLLKNIRSELRKQAKTKKKT